MTITAERVRDFKGDDHHYFYPPTDQRLPSVTTILSATDGKRYLIRWSAKVAAKYCIGNWRKIVQIIRKEGAEAAIKLVTEESERIRGLKADAGKYVHKVVEALILWAAEPDHGDEVPIPELPEHLRGVEYEEDQPLEDVVDWMIIGFTNFVRDFNPDFQAAEMTVFNIGLGVAGTLDMIIVLHGVAIGRNGRLVPAPGQSVIICVDVKTGKHLDCTVPEQGTAYRHMTECLLPLGELAPMLATDAFAVLHLRPEFEAGYRLMLVAGADDAAAWNRFRRAVELYDGRHGAKAKPGKVCYPLRADGTMRSPRIADLDGEGYGTAPGYLVKAGVDDLEMLSVLSAAECLALKGIGPKSMVAIRTMLADHGLHLADEPPAEMVA